jgi:hypothetical protein
MIFVLFDALSAKAYVLIIKHEQKSETIIEISDKPTLILPEFLSMQLSP